MCYIKIEWWLCHMCSQIPYITKKTFGSEGLFNIIAALRPIVD